MSIFSLPPHEITIDLEPIDAEFIGPALNADMRVWRNLVDFNRWHLWMPECSKVESKKIGSEIGRGSTFVVYGQSSADEIEVLYWSPGKKLVLCHASNQMRSAYCFEIVSASKKASVILCISAEIELRDSGLLFRWLKQRRAAKTFSHQCDKLATVLN